MISSRVTYTWQIIRAGFSEEVEDWSDVTMVSAIIQTPEPTNYFPLITNCNFLLEKLVFQFQSKVLGPDSKCRYLIFRYIQIILKPLQIDTKLWSLIRVCNQQSFSKENDYAVLLPGAWSIGVACDFSM